MKKFCAKMDNMLINAKLKLQQAIKDEGGMEVIQMLVLLALGLALIGAFIAFKDEIMGTVNDLIDEFLGDFG